MSLNKIKQVISGASKAGVVCCFCGETVAQGSLVTMNLELGDEQNQSLYTHGLCLKAKLHPSIPFMAPEELSDE